MCLKVRSVDSYTQLLLLVNRYTEKIKVGTLLAYLAQGHRDDTENNKSYKNAELLLA